MNFVSELNQGENSGGISVSQKKLRFVWFFPPTLSVHQKKECQPPATEAKTIQSESEHKKTRLLNAELPP